LPKQCATNDVVVVFTSSQTAGQLDWKDYLEEITPTTSLRVVPVAVSRDGLAHGNSGSFKNLNFLRLYEWDLKLRKEWAAFHIAPEIYRHGLGNIDEDEEGKRSSIKVFLSHAKSGNVGKEHAKKIKYFIAETNLRSFFDATEISPGFKFNQEIAKHVNASTLIAISSDAYSSRYWCKKEVLLAKEYRRPIIAVDCRKEYEDRIFPEGANVPCVHVGSTPLKEEDIFRVLLAAIFETIRYFYAYEILSFYRERNWIAKDCALSSRPPEVRQVLALKAEGVTKVCYPEPLLYAEESDWLEGLGVEGFTPLWSKSEQDCLMGCSVGISISNCLTCDFSQNHIHPDSMVLLAQDIARHLLARAVTVLYGGDLRDNGFTQFILDEAEVLANRLDGQSIHVENHLAWPLYLEDEKLVQWRACYSRLMRSCEYGVPDDLKGSVDTEQLLQPNSPQNKYILARCLTKMRQGSVSASTARICVGGKRAGYTGKMPGVLEEIIIAVEMKKPLYLLGGYGGIVGDFCTSLSSKELSASLTEKWQETHNKGYSQVQTEAEQFGYNAKYDAIKDMIMDLTICELSQNAGLSEEDYIRLMESPFNDECVHLILKGIKTIWSSKNTVRRG